MQVSGGPAYLNAPAIVIMGGLAIPNRPPSKDDLPALIQRYGPVKGIGVGFMRLFEKAGRTGFRGI